jgi:hypothetical protein
MASLAGTIAMEGKSSTTGKAITLSKNEPLFQEARKDILSRPHIRANLVEETMPTRYLPVNSSGPLPAEDSPLTLPT